MKKKKPGKKRGGIGQKRVTLEMQSQYHAYLQSTKWKEKRRQALEFFGSQCGLCGSKFNLQVHHKTYENIFKETMADLMIVCDTCHRAHHRQQDSKIMRRSKYIKGSYCESDTATYYPNRRQIA